MPRLTWCDSYRLEADCVLGGGTSVGRLVLNSGDPVAPARELAPFDSKVVRAARMERLILCIGEERCCAEEPLELDARIARYRRKVDPRAVLEIVDPGVLKAVPQSPQTRKASKRLRSQGEKQVG